MAQRRMFSKQIVDSDAFLDMPQSSRLLYFSLAMQADDDGFVGNPKNITRAIGASQDDLKVLMGKRFILSFESGVIVIKHWRIHNYIQNDRYRETKYIEEKGTLILKENGSYTECIQDVSNLDTQDRLELGKDSIGEREDTPAEISKSFFKGEKYYDEIRATFLEKVPEQILDQELEKFVLYWTEPNKSGTRVRWEQQPTFDVKRRLFTWLSKVSQFTKTANKGRGLA